jgi:hypothetical protein
MNWAQRAGRSEDKLFLEGKSMPEMPRIKSLADLRRIKEAALAQAGARGKEKTRVVVKLGKCRMAAAMHTVMEAFTEEVQ